MPWRAAGDANNGFTVIPPISSARQKGHAAFGGILLRLPGWMNWRWIWRRSNQSRNAQLNSSGP